METWVRITPDRSAERKTLTPEMARRHASIQRTLRRIKYSGDQRIGRIEIVVLESVNAGAWIKYRQLRDTLLKIGEIGMISQFFLGGTALETMNPVGKTLHYTTIRTIRATNADKDATP
jgi:hypothetical protein